MGYLAILWLILYSFEKYLSKKWFVLYYRTGIPIYYCKKSYIIYNLFEVIKKNENLELKKISANRIIFRKGTFKRIAVQLYEFSPFRGIIMLNEIERKIKVIYFINWHLLDLVLMLALAVIMSSYEIIIVSVLILIIGYITKEIYETQRILFNT